jgi:hypothetical protein
MVTFIYSDLLQNIFFNTLLSFQFNLNIDLKIIFKNLLINFCILNIDFLIKVKNYNKWKIMQINELIIRDTIFSNKKIVNSNLWHFIFFYIWILTHHSITICSTWSILYWIICLFRRWWIFLTINCCCLRLMLKKRWSHRIWWHTWSSTILWLITISFKCCFICYQIFTLDKY